MVLFIKQYQRLPTRHKRVIMSRIDHTYCVHSMAKKARTEKESNMAPEKMYK